MNRRLVFGQGVPLLAWVVVVLALSTPLHGASCSQKDYEVHGTVTDRSGRPIPDSPATLRFMKMGTFLIS
jgi:hypothetical protein